jgi:hypothetical protein
MLGAPSFITIVGAIEDLDRLPVPVDGGTVTLTAERKSVSSFVQQNPPTTIGLE